MHYEQQTIRERAYSIWQREGCPCGREQEHWMAAEREIELEHNGSARAHAAVEIEDADPRSDLPKRRRRPAARTGTSKSGISNGRATRVKKSTSTVTERQ